MQKDDGCGTRLTLLRNSLGKELGQDVRRIMIGLSRLYRALRRKYKLFWHTHSKRSSCSTSVVPEAANRCMCTLERRRATDTLTLSRLFESLGELKLTVTSTRPTPRDGGAIKTIHTETVHDSFFGSGEHDRCYDDWFGDDDYHSGAGSWATDGDWQEINEDQQTWCDVNWEEDSWNVSRRVS